MVASVQGWQVHLRLVAIALFWSCISAARVLHQACNSATLNPCVSITSPTAGTASVVGTPIYVEAWASPSPLTAGALRGVEFYVVPAGYLYTPQCKLATITTSTSSVFKWTWAKPVPGKWSVVARASFNETYSTWSLPVNVSITGTASANLAPSIYFTSPLVNNTIRLAGTRLYFEAAVCDLDGSVGNTTFYANGTQFFTASYPYTTYTADKAGLLNITAVATDNLGLNASAYLLVNVTGAVGSPPSPPGGNSPPTPPAPGPSGCSTFSLTVVGGSGSGMQCLYTKVPILAAAPPTGKVFSKWVMSGGAIQVDDPFHYNTTVQSSGSSAITATATYLVDPGIPAPVTTHPRLLITQAMLPALRSWATNSNPMYYQGFASALSSAISYSDSRWSWTFKSGTGKPFQPGCFNTACWRDTGGALFEQDATEAYAMFFAFASLISPSNSTAMPLAYRAKDMLMWVINKAASCTNTSTPFCGANFNVYDRSRWWGDGFALTYDWLQYWPNIFTSSEKSTIRKVFLQWGDLNTMAYMAPPTKIYNNPGLIQNGAQRGSMNNYNSGHFRLLILMALSFDAKDDPAVDTWLPAGKVGNTVRSYVYSATGAYLYQKYACMEQPATAAAALGVNVSLLVSCAQGGYEPEGMFYGSSMSWVLEGLTALHTAGWNDVALSGPQMRLSNSSVWDKWAASFLHSLTPAPFTATGGNAYLGSVWQFFNFGDNLRTYVSHGYFEAWGFLGLYAKLTGNTATLQKAQWAAANVIQGGVPKLFERSGYGIWGNSYAHHPILYFLIFDPTTAANPAGIPDPRPGLGTQFYDPGMGRIMARSSSTAAATVFSFKCSWMAINHQEGDCGMFEIYRNGEWLTKENTGYASDSSTIVGSSSVLKNSLSIQNSCPNNTDLPSINQPDILALVKLGSQMASGYGVAGDPIVTQSFGTGYMAVNAIMENLYNIPNFWNPQSAMLDVKHASRSVVWLQWDYVVIFDRAQSGRAGRFKRFHMNFITLPVLAGATVSSTSPKGQVLSVTTLLPSQSNITITTIPPWGTIAEYESSKYRMIVEDPAKPATARWLHVLQIRDSSAVALSSAKLVCGSVNGGALGSVQGAAFGNFVVMFVNDIVAAPPTAVSGIQFTQPAGVTARIVTGLAPGKWYDAGVDAANKVTVTRSATGRLSADPAGVLRF